MGQGLCQLAPHVLPRPVDADAIDIRIWPGKIDIFKNAKCSIIGKVCLMGMETLCINDDDLSRANIPHKFAINGIKRAGFRGDNKVIIQLAYRQRRIP